MSFEALLRQFRQEPGEQYAVFVPGRWRQETEKALEQLISEAQTDKSPFTPDDLTSELQFAVHFLATTPRDLPGLEIYSESETPLDERTHVWPGSIINIWYRIWDKEQLVLIKVEPSKDRRRPFV